MNQSLVVGNWKMNPITRREATDLFLSVRDECRNISGVETVICPPFLWIPTIYDARGTSTTPALGAQDVFWKHKGSHTGEVSPTQLTEFNVAHTIVGHSERRAIGETDEQVAQKARAALDATFTVIVCVGEHERGEGTDHKEILRQQLVNSLAGVAGEHAARVVIAYEPIWAIGGEEAMDPASIDETAAFLRTVLQDIYPDRHAEKIRIIYGGSVDGTNIDSIMSEASINGVLPGRASRDPGDFRAIVETVRDRAGED